MDAITPAQALQNLHSIAENVALNGRDRDIARQSTQALDEVIKQRDALLAEKEAPKPTEKAQA